MKVVQKNNGFTLVEIVVVIGIMAFFTAIIYSTFDTSKANSRDQKRVSDISTIQLALELYFNKNGVYPLTLDELTIKPKNATAAYISEIPKDPSTNKTYSDPSSQTSGYFPITKTSNSPDFTKCISYQLWTTFENTNIYLESKKGFNSSRLSLYDNLSECVSGSGHKQVDASVNPLIYDVMP